MYILLEHKNRVHTITSVSELLGFLAEHDLVTEAAALQATADADRVQSCVMAQVEYLRPHKEEEGHWAKEGEIPIETLTCGNPNDPEFRQYVHDTLDEYFKYAMHHPAWNRFWIGGASCNHPDHK